MKVASIVKGSDAAYRKAAKMVAQALEDELDTAADCLGVKPGKVLDILGTIDWIDPDVDWDELEV